MRKNPWLAAFLNIIISGLGYIYVGKRKLFGTLLLVGEILIYIWLFTSEAAVINQLLNVWVILAGISWVIALAIDAYNDAKTV